MSIRFTGESSAFLEQQFNAAIKSADSVRRISIPPEHQLQFIQALQESLSERAQALQDIIKVKGDVKTT